MPALGFGLAADRGDDRCRERRKKTEHRRRRRARAASPDSGTTSAAAGGLVTSTSGLSSLGSDLDAFFSQITFSHLAGREGSGPDPDQEKRNSFAYSDALSRPLDRNHSSKLKESEEDDKDEEALDAASHSFSFALRECQNRRFRSEAHSLPGRKPRRRRPASLDLNGPGPPGVDVAVLSPRFLMSGAGFVKKSSTAASSRCRSGVFPIPGTPSYRNGCGAMAYQKGWSSERVPLPANSCRRYMGGGALLPFNNGRALPSKWEDAEKWICSPMSGDGAGRPSLPPTHHRRPKSKSGPLGAPAGISGSYSAASPLVPCFDSGRVGSFMAGSPFLAGVLVADRGGSGSYSSAGSGGRGCGDGGRRSSSANAEPYIMRSASIHGWSDALIESSSSLPSSQDENVDSTREAAIINSPVLRKDVATQMSPDGSTQSSPKERPSFSPSPSAQPIEELESHFSKMEVRDVQVDDRVTVTRWSKKHTNRGFDKRSTNIIEWKKKSVEAKASGWDVAETTKCIAKYKREEAKITAWENLQNARAEAEIRKLEMKLEKKRSSSMDKILNKLRSAQRKAQEMRSAATASQSHEVARTNKRISYFRRTGQISSLSGCFTCHAF